MPFAPVPRLWSQSSKHVADQSISLRKIHEGAVWDQEKQAAVGDCNAVTVHQHLADALPFHVILDLPCGEAEASRVLPKSDGVVEVCPTLHHPPSVSAQCPDCDHKKKHNQHEGRVWRQP